MTSRMTENLIKILFFIAIFTVVFLQSLLTKAATVKVPAAQRAEQNVIDRVRNGGTSGAPQFEF